MKLVGFILSLTLVLGQELQKIDIEDQIYWRSVGTSTLEKILNRKQENGVAKNVIIFVGDGMGVSTVTMSRIYQGQLKNMSGENNILSFENFPAVGLSKASFYLKTCPFIRSRIRLSLNIGVNLKSVRLFNYHQSLRMPVAEIPAKRLERRASSPKTTYDTSHQVADSASTATAMFSGIKINQRLLGLDMTARFDNCNEEINKMAKVKGIMTWAQEKGKDTGIVTTARVTHATPAGTYAHVNNRNWECDSAISTANIRCTKDIARQLVEDQPGNKFKVILGGGRLPFGSSDPLFDDSCKRADGKNLVESWKKNKVNAQYVTTAKELEAVNTADCKYLLGLFAPGHLSYVGEKNPTRPSLTLMTKKAIEILEKNTKGFILMVEAARIDMAHHDNYAKLAMKETVEFDEAISAAVKMTNSNETLIIVTADHSHSVVINGYPKRGNDILGLAENSEKSFYETVSYANGPGYEYHHSKNQSEAGNCRGNCSEIEKLSLENIRDIRNEPNRENDIYYRHFAGLYKDIETHGGEDVAVYASGPMSHLLVGVYEQNYIANVISYAACIGPEAHRCKNRKVSKSSGNIFFSKYFLILSLVGIIKFF